MQTSTEKINTIIENQMKVQNTYKKSDRKQLIAISGGQDSIFLLNLIENFQDKYKEMQEKENISCIYIDHQWRQDSYEQTIHIINYIRSIKRKIYVYQLPNNLLSEKLCRIYRYHLFTKHAIKHSNKLIVTGHNETDKVETFLSNFFRGSGWQGITSLVIQSKINHNTYLLRPLLNLKRSQIYWACKKFYLPIWSDNTNYQYKFERNRTRYELIPYLKKYFNRNIESKINLVLKNCYRDNEYIRQSTIKLYLTIKHPLYIAINHNKLRKQNFAIQVKIIQLFCVHNLNFNLKHNEINKILIHINKNPIHQYFLITLEYLKMHVNQNWIYITL
uniref:tRNA(Ile)-lysidine synthase, chloroplastic n=1 Tax=Laurencia australis TaxID=3073067 RepID=A0AA51RFS1_9FLOR|nr:tRNA(Ile)-lysidine synthase [Laurencia australis]WMP11987.1 tRNA(Ile)-lysidine synthase [Laurencia australis]